MVQHHPDPRLTAAALACARQGWAVFPLRPGTKVPAVAGWQDAATRDPDRLRTWWAREPFNLGVATGPSGLVVVDLDVPKPDDTDRATGARVLADLAAGLGQEVPVTFTVTTPSGGQHRYHHTPVMGAGGRVLRNTAGRIGRRIGTRAVGGYVVGPGSVLDGRVYTVTDTRSPVPLPDWLTDHLTATSTPASVRADRPVLVPLPAGRGRRAAYLRSAIAAETRRVSQAVPGGRNAALFVASVALGQLAAGGAVSAEQVHDVLDHACTGHYAAGAFTPAQAARTIASGLRAGARRPRHLPAA